MPRNTAACPFRIYRHASNSGYDGKPLYTYVNDTMPGDVNGDNVGNVWHVVR
jgi:predicted lipoprotein with Yx(FWY)xxD motif